MTRPRRAALAIVLALLMGGIVGAPGAGAAVVSCGQTITQSTTLTADVGPCSGNGIVVGADNIVLDLNGRRVLGNGDQGAGGDFAGIRLAQRTGVAIRGPGVVGGFEAGIVVNRGGSNTLSGLAVQDNLGSADFDLASLGDGIVLISSARNTVANNVLAGNGRFDGIGVLGVGADANVVRSNIVRDTQGAPGEVASGQGILFDAVFEVPPPMPGQRLFDNQVLFNRVLRSASVGISQVSSVNSTIRGNLSVGNGDHGIGVIVNPLTPPETNVLVQGNVVASNRSSGIDLSTSANRVLDNQVTGHVGAGIDIRGVSRGAADNNVVSGNNLTGNAEGIRQLGGRSNSIVRNSVTGNRLDGILLTSTPASGLLSTDTDVASNVVKSNGTNGIWLTDLAKANRVRGNDAAGNRTNPSASPSPSFDLSDSNAGCDANTWSANKWGSGGFSQPCVTA